MVANCASQQKNSKFLESTFPRPNRPDDPSPPLRCERRLRGRSGCPNVGEPYWGDRERTGATMADVGSAPGVGPRVFVRSRWTIGAISGLLRHPRRKGDGLGTEHDPRTGQRSPVGALTTTELAADRPGLVGHGCATGLLRVLDLPPPLVRGQPRRRGGRPRDPGGPADLTASRV